MYLLTEAGSQIVNTEFVERFCVARKPDAVLIVASYSTERPPVTLGRYADGQEACAALLELYGAMAGGQACFTMPEGRVHSGEAQVRDARTKRRGGS